MIVCVDTNVWLDVLQNRPDFVRDSSQALSLLEEEEHSVLVCATTITTIHYLFSKYTTKTQSRTAIQKMLDRYNVAQVDGEVLSTALLLDWDDYEDAVLYVAGLRAGADALLTRDREGFKSASLPVLTPAELVRALS